MSLVEQLAIVQLECQHEFWSVVGYVTAYAIIGAVVLYLAMRILAFLGRYTSGQLMFIAIMGIPAVIIGSNKTPSKDFHFASVGGETVSEINFSWQIPEDDDYVGPCYIQVQEPGQSWRNVSNALDFTNKAGKVTGNFISRGINRRFRLFIPSNGRTQNVQEEL